LGARHSLHPLWVKIMRNSGEFAPRECYWLFENQIGNLPLSSPTSEAHARPPRERTRSSG
jgi:hypothetical protein